MPSVVTWFNPPSEWREAAKDVEMVDQEEGGEEEEGVRGWRGTGKRQGAYTIGQRVQAKFRDGGWYGAKIAGTKGDKCLINWDDDGAKDRSLPASR
eukprot:1869848-Rhodomonas_salina.1